MKEAERKRSRGMTEEMAEGKGTMETQNMKTDWVDRELKEREGMTLELKESRKGEAKSHRKLFCMKKYIKEERQWMLK